MGKAQFFLGEVGACMPYLTPPFAGEQPCNMNSSKLASAYPGLVNQNTVIPSSANKLL